MNTRKQQTAILGVGAAACAACCAGPILGFLAAIGLGTAVGFAVFGVAALVVGALAAIVVTRQRRRSTTHVNCCTTPAGVTCSSRSDRSSQNAVANCAERPSAS